MKYTDGAGTSVKLKLKNGRYTNDDLGNNPNYLGFKISGENKLALLGPRRSPKECSQVELLKTDQKIWKLILSDPAPPAMGPQAPKIPVKQMLARSSEKPTFQLTPDGKTMLDKFKLAKNQKWILECP